MVDYTRVELEFLVGFADTRVVETHTLSSATSLAERVLNLQHLVSLKA